MSFGKRMIDLLCKDSVKSAKDLLTAEQLLKQEDRYNQQTVTSFIEDDEVKLPLICNGPKTQTKISAKDSVSPASDNNSSALDDGTGNRRNSGSSTSSSHSSSYSVSNSPVKGITTANTDGTISPIATGKQSKQRSPQSPAIPPPSPSATATADARKVLKVKRLYVRDRERNDDGVGWILNECVDNCMLCEAPFDTFRWKHHCRACGNVICDSCSSTTVQIVELSECHFQRACDLCAQVQYEIVHAKRLRLRETDIIGRANYYSISLLRKEKKYKNLDKALKTPELLEEIRLIKERLIELKEAETRCDQAQISQRLALLDFDPLMDLDHPDDPVDRTGYEYTTSSGIGRYTAGGNNATVGQAASISAVPPLVQQYHLEEQLYPPQSHYPRIEEDSIGGRRQLNHHHLHHSEGSAEEGDSEDFEDPYQQQDRQDDSRMSISTQLVMQQQQSKNRK